MEPTNSPTLSSMESLSIFLLNPTPSNNIYIEDILRGIPAPPYYNNFTEDLLRDLPDIPGPTLPTMQTRMIHMQYSPEFLLPDIQVNTGFTRLTGQLTYIFRNESGESS